MLSLQPIEIAFIIALGFALVTILLGILNR
jgi:hypothetical protein